MRSEPVLRPVPLALLVLGLGACRTEPISAQGRFGAPIELVTGDMSPLPRVAFIDEGCPGEIAAGGCPASGDRQCVELLIDSLAPLTTIRDDAVTEGNASVDQECIEIRSAEGLAFDPIPPESLESAVTRFRFFNVPLLRAPGAGTDRWTWDVGDEAVRLDPGGVLGGNLLNEFAVVLRDPPDRAPQMRLFGEFPGTESDLADQGRAYLPLQFPGSLLGRDIEDRCEIDGDNCELAGYDLSPGQGNIALESTRMVLDACVAPPPCTVVYARDDDPFLAGRCRRSVHSGTRQECVDADATVLGGRPASLLVATSVNGLVLFDDSARRMFGPIDELATCDQITADSAACLIANDGQLFFTGWPDAGLEDPLPRIAVRALALVAGARQPRDANPCERVDRRHAGLLEQCRRWAQSARTAGDIRDTAPPFSGVNDESDGDGHVNDFSARAIVTVGETTLDPLLAAPNADRWINTHILPATHPLVLTLRRDVAPQAIEPDGLVGTNLFDATELILDYTDPDPGIRVKCLEPHRGTCESLPQCRTDGQAACCYGLPVNLLADYILAGEQDTCCGALSASELEEVQLLGHCLGVDPP